MKKMNSSREDYLEAVLVLQRQLGLVRSVDLADHLKVTKPSVSRAVSTLKDDGFLIMDQDNFLYLTDSGREIAERIYERHCFFRKKLIAAGVSPEVAEEEACKMEHAISEDTFHLLVKAYDAPKSQD